MWKIAALCALGLLVSVISEGASAASSGFKLCESTYALCTTAACTPVAGEKDTVSCPCEVKTGYSAGQEDCQQVTETDQGKQIRSRYFPVTSYAVCTNDRDWAWCLDKPCIIDPDDPTKASCTCSTVNKQGPYVIVTDTMTDTTCTTGVISSATVKGIEQITDFLKTTSELKPFPIKVLNSPN